jgi:2-oxoglutarate dehydrogenase E1 component
MVNADPDKPTIDWGMGEHLAYGTLLWEGTHIRLSGQDSRRGTFSHRHAMWVDQVNALKYFPLSHLTSDQALFDVFNSPLSEFAVLGFDFGYSVAYPKSLVIWEAQFGDFCNGAQIIIDQYIAASEQKWNQSCNLTLKLPHGYEGQGPEHSSARIERFLQLCGDDNIRVANCTTPAQLFHLLRRQALCNSRKPLVLFTPKALLRYPACVSSLNDLTVGSFQEVLDDPLSPKKIKRLLLCSGKVYYDLILAREKRKVERVAIVRIEQLYPLNWEALHKVLDRYGSCEEIVWVQEEHENMGAWQYIQAEFMKELKMPLRYIGRGRNASPAVGSHTLHKQQLENLIEETFKV